ncbi:MAG: YaiI/YqxD family protein [SAR324 cluster bacterium]|nr:YaiI/YqxD family protein [SAR324 cluster bacterium]
MEEYDLAAFTLFIDADACPRLVKEVIFKAALKQKIPTFLVANRFSETPKTPWIKPIVVDAGPDVADAYIVDNVNAGDLVVTGDIPLAALLLAKKAMVIDHRGKEFNNNNINEMLSFRDFSADLRESGIETAGPKAFTPKDREAFANALNRCLTLIFNRLKKPSAT